MTETAEVAALRAANEAREAKKREERLERAEGDQPRRVRVPRPRALHQRELAEARFLADQASGKRAEQRAAAAAATARLRVQREKEQAERAEAQRAAAAAAERRELEELEALVRSILRENPFSEHASEDEETEWRELAHASRQLLPLFEALGRPTSRIPNMRDIEPASASGCRKPRPRSPSSSNMGGFIRFANVRLARRAVTRLDLRTRPKQTQGGVTRRAG
jgi:hypothetical protein